MSVGSFPKVIDQAVEVLIATEQTAIFDGTGLDDLTAGGTTTGKNQIFEVEIDAEGTPDTFKWRVNGGSYTPTVSITGAAQTLTDGLTVTFGATTGHTLADSWRIYVCGNKLGTDQKDVLVKKIHVTNVDGSNAAEISISRASDGLAIGAWQKDIGATTTATLDFSPEGMLFPDGILLSAEASSDLVAYVIAAETLS